MLVKTKKFADLLQEAVATERSLRQLLYHRDSKPSPSAAMAEASRRAGTTPDRLTMLEQSLNERPLQLVERARGFVGKVVEAQREGKFRLSGNSKTSTCTSSTRSVPTRRSSSSCKASAPRSWRASRSA